MLDYLIKQGLLIDGTGEKSYVADIAIDKGKIAKIGSNLALEAKEVRNAKGMVVSPGFIDIHSHSDLCPFVKGLKPQSKLYQGITLEIIGNCGMSNLPVDDVSRKALTNFISTGLQLPMHGLILEDDSISDYVKHVELYPAATNVGVLIGHGTLRGCVVGFGMQKASAAELKRMKELLDRELTRGAFGMSLGLIYPPSSYGDMEEFIELAKVLKKHNAILTVHMRSESTQIFEAVEEMLEVARQTKVHLEISHLKLMGKTQWGRADELLQKLKAARQKGIDVTCDQYPYLATSTGLSALIPDWATDGGPQKMCARLVAPDAKLLQEISEEMERRGGASCILIVASHGKNTEFNGMTLDKIAKHMHTTADRAVAKLLVEAAGGVNCCYFCLNKEDMLKIMKEKFISVGTDGYALSFDKSFMDSNSHPRSFGTFPRYLQTIREEKLMSMEDAIYKITALPANVLGLKDRGLLREGNAADITIFDHQNVQDMAEYVDSLCKPKGIRDVFIDGKLALKDGEQVGAPFGRVILHETC